MKFNPAALVVLVLFFGALAFAMSRGSGAFHAAEAIVTVLIAIGIGGLAFRNHKA